jgi:iron(III) transport system permease protein
MKELPATLLLRPTGLETLATRMWASTEIGAYAAAAPYAALLILLAALPTFLLGHRRRSSTLDAESGPDGTSPYRSGGRLETAEVST